MRQRWIDRAGLSFAFLLAFYVTSAYYVLPRFWTHYDARSAGLLRPMVTVTLDGRPGDPINIGIRADQAELDDAMRHAGWTKADPVTLVSSLHIITSVVFDRTYAAAPVSPLFYEGQTETIAYEKAAGHSADRRQHVRFWLQPASLAGDQPSWLGSVTFDQGVGLSHYTGAVTHDIAADIDRARDALVSQLQATGAVFALTMVAGVGPTSAGRNGEGSPYRTDGLAALVTLDQP